MNDLKKILYRVTCEVHRLKINKNMDFETKIMWKRRTLLKLLQTKRKQKPHPPNIRMATQSLIKLLPFSSKCHTTLKLASTNQKMFFLFNLDLNCCSDCLSRKSQKWRIC